MPDSRRTGAGADEASTGARPSLYSVPTSSRPGPARSGAATVLVDAAVAVVEQLCGRALSDGTSTTPTPYGQVAIELRDLLPTVDDPAFDTAMSAIARAAWLVTVGETAEHDEDAFAEAAWAAGIDRIEFDLSDEGDAEFRAAVIEHWDLEVRAQVADLVAAEVGPVADASPSGRFSRPASA